MQDRAIRRHHAKRIKKKVRRQLKATPWFKNEIDGCKMKRLTHDEIEEKIVRVCSRRLNARTPCSCVMCGNPRRMLKELTIQELRANITEE